MSNFLKDIRGMATPELKHKLLETREELSKERSLIASHTRSEKPSKAKILRRNVARILTVLNEKENKK